MYARVFTFYLLLKHKLMMTSAISGNLRDKWRFGKLFVILGREFEALLGYEESEFYPTI